MEIYLGRISMLLQDFRRDALHFQEMTQIFHGGTICTVQNMVEGTSARGLSRPVTPELIISDRFNKVSEGLRGLRTSFQ